jgi:hypothetical protein
MDVDRFDALTRALADGRTRRGFMAVVAAALGGTATAGTSFTADAKRKKKHKKRRKKRKKAKKNEFGCVDVGKFCKNDGQCCSDICEGNECQAHGESTCQPGQDICLGVEVPCVTETGQPGQCTTTTGEASYCFAEGDCFPCSKDADCQAICGPQAACIVCAQCLTEGLQTACVGPSNDSCAFN